MNTPHQENAISSILSHSRKVKKIGAGKWMASCVMPDHNDKNPSMGVTLKPDGVILARCFGCGASGSDICHAIGINPVDLFPPTANPRYTKQQRSSFSAWQLLHALEGDLIFLVVAANQMKKDGRFDQSDVDCFVKICERINESLQYLEGSRHG